MAEEETAGGGNADQAAYWNQVAGPKWVAMQHDIDCILSAVVDALLAWARPAEIEAEAGRGARLMDIGCGTGATAFAFAEAAGPDARITGIDISEPMLAEAEKRRADLGLERLDFRLADAQTHDFGRAADGGAAGPPFDQLFSRFGVMFFADPVAAFGNLATALRPGGRIVFAAWAPVAVNPWFAIPRDVAVARLGPPPATPPRAPGPMAFQEIPYVRDILAAAGFSDIRGEAVPVTLTHPGSPEAVGRLAANLGPSARILKAYDGTAEDEAAIAAQVAEAFHPYARPEGGLGLPAILNLFAAVKPSRP